MNEDAAQFLERIGQLIGGEQSGILRHQGLQPVHGAILRYLGQANRYSNGPVAVAEYLGLTRGTVSVSLRHLESRGLIARESAAEDARRVGYVLTEAGRKLCRDLQDAPLLGAALKQLGPARTNELSGLLRALLEGMQEAHGGRRFGLCRTCRHYRPDLGGTGTCGLTGAALNREDGGRVCRHWADPATKAA